MYLHYVKIGFSAILLISAFLCVIYSLFLLFQFWGKRLTKHEVIRKTFAVTFCGFMAIFLASYIWQAERNFTHLALFLIFSISLSLIGAFAFIASFLTRKE